MEISKYIGNKKVMQIIWKFSKRKKVSSQIIETSTVAAEHRVPLLGCTPALTANNTKYATALRSVQIDLLTNSEKSMIYFSRNCSSPQGARSTSHI